MSDRGGYNKGTNYSINSTKEIGNYGKYQFHDSGLAGKRGIKRRFIHKKRAIVGENVVIENVTFNKGDIAFSWKRNSGTENRQLNQEAIKTSVFGKHIPIIYNNFDSSLIDDWIIDPSDPFSEFMFKNNWEVMDGIIVHGIVKEKVTFAKSGIVDSSNKRMSVSLFRSGPKTILNDFKFWDKFADEYKSDSILQPGDRVRCRFPYFDQQSENEDDRMFLWDDNKWKFNIKWYRKWCRPVMPSHYQQTMGVMLYFEKVRDNEQKDEAFAFLLKMGAFASLVIPFLAIPRHLALKPLDIEMKSLLTITDDVEGKITDLVAEPSFNDIEERTRQVLSIIQGNSKKSLIWNLNSDVIEKVFKTLMEDKHDDTCKSGICGLVIKSKQYDNRVDINFDFCKIH
jgi:hypothetical protein